MTFIGEKAFHNCSILTSVTIPGSVTSIGSEAFSWCPINDVYCYAENVPEAGNYPFGNIANATLYVPEASLEAYKTTAPWSGFGVIERIETRPVCAKPVIIFEDGKLQFSCETEDAKCVYSVTSPLSTVSTDSDDAMPKTYIVSVYATKDGYRDSEVATMEIEVSGGSTAKKGDVNEDGNVNGTDIQEVINIIVRGE